MLTITKIIEGGIDLSTQEELPRCISVSNGVKEVTIPMPNGSMEKIVELYIEGLGAQRQRHAEQVVEAVKTVVPGQMKVSNVRVEEETAHVEAQVAPEMPADNITMRIHGGDDYDAPPSDDDGFLPGEDYEDSGTGAASL